MSYGGRPKRLGIHEEGPRSVDGKVRGELPWGVEIGSQAQTVTRGSPGPIGLDVLITPSASTRSLGRRHSDARLRGFGHLSFVRAVRCRERV